MPASTAPQIGFLPDSSALRISTEPVATGCEYTRSHFESSCLVLRHYRRRGRGHLPLRLDCFAWAAVAIAALSVLGASASPPIIVTQPISITTTVHSLASLQVGVTGSMPISYQWWKDGFSMLHATNASLQITNAEPIHIGSYRLRAVNTDGVATSDVASVTLDGVDGDIWRGLVAYYPCNGEVRDFGLHGYSWATSGSYLTARDRHDSFDSAMDCATTGIVSKLYSTATNPVSLSFWVKASSYRGVAAGWPRYNGVYTRPLGDFCGMGILLFPTGIICLTSFSSVQLYSHRPTPDWQMITICYSNDIRSTRVYQNGIRVAWLTNMFSATEGLPTNPLLRSSDATHGAGENQIDDIRVYNRVMDAAAIVGIYASESPPHAAQAVVEVVAGSVVNVVVTDLGAGYTGAPPIRVLGGGGMDAQLHAYMSNGVVSSIAVLNPGSGYTSTPIVVVAPPKIASPVITSLSPASQLSYSSLEIGSNYQPQVSVAGLWAPNASAFNAYSEYFTQYVSGIVASGVFRLVRFPVFTQATATSRVVNGFVVGVYVTNRGSGYTSAPLVSLVGEGSNASAIASINAGQVTGVAVVAVGAGYTTPPQVVIASPPVLALSPTIDLFAELGTKKLSAYDTYSLQRVVSAPLSEWSTHSKGIVPTAATCSIYLSITNDFDLLRLLYTAP
jgi:hypothetical protein